MSLQKLAMLREKLISRKSNLGLREKFFLSLLILVVIPFLLLGELAYLQSSKIIERNVSVYSLDTMKQISRNIDYYITEMDRVTSYVVGNDDIKTYLAQYNTLSELEKVDVSDKINKLIANLIGLRNEISGLYLFDTSGNFFYARGRSPKSLYDFRNESWYKDTLAKSGKINIIGTHLQYHVLNNPKTVFSVSRSLKSLNPEKTVGLIWVDMDYSVIDRQINSESDPALSSGDLYILDNKGKIVFNKNSKLLMKDFNAGFSKTIFSRPQGTFTENINGKDMFIVFYTSPYSSWKIVNITPLNTILTDSGLLKKYILITTVICIAVILFLSFGFANRLVKPIKSLVRAMSELEKGNLSATVDIHTTDEIGFLSEGFNNMAKNMKYLIEKVYSAQLNQKEAELKALQTQINPHFLYNTLESIRGVAITEGIHSIALMSKSLSNLFRYNIKGKDIVSLKDEIDHINNYIIIQNFRFGDRFNVEYFIAESLYDYKILKLLLQPLVENSINHGLKKRKTNGCITVKCEKIDENIKITISDNGIGIPGHTVAMLNDLLTQEVQTDPVSLQSDNSESDSIGIKNVNTRIKLFYGNEYGLKYYSEESVGTRVEIKIPAVREGVCLDKNINS